MAETIVESENAETVKFYWKVSSESGGDYLQFYIDSTLKDQISGEVDWQQKSYSVPAGTHTLKWRGACPEFFEGSKTPAARTATIAPGWVLSNGPALPPPKTPLIGQSLGDPLREKSPTSPPGDGLRHTM